MIRHRFEQSGKKIEDTQFVPNCQSKSKKMSSKWILKLILLIVLILYVVVPLSFYLSSTVRRHAVFLHYVSLSRNKNLSVPAEMGLTCTRNFYISSENNIKLGVWHVPPYETQTQCEDEYLPMNEEFTDNQPVFLYLHGNAGSRGGSHRVQLYKVLSEKLNAHIIAFDYRGFGDSTNESPYEQGLVQDTLHVYRWLLKRVNTSRVFIWGHSLGTGVGVAFLEYLSSSGQDLPAALILEAPFTKIIDAARFHPLSFLHRHMPFFEFFIADPIGEKDTGFNSINRIQNVNCPLLILHAEDDGFVPYTQGKELYNRALSAKQNNHAHNTQFVGFDKKLDLGHKNIYKSPDLPNIIKKFMKNIHSI